MAPRTPPPSVTINAEPVGEPVGDLVPTDEFEEKVLAEESAEEEFPEHEPIEIPDLEDDQVMTLTDEQLNKLQAPMSFCWH